MKLKKPCGLRIIYMSLCRDFLNQDFAGLSRVDQKVWSSNMSKKSLKVWLPRDVLRIICFCVKHKKIGGTWPFNPHWLIFLGRAGAMKDRNVPKPMEKKNLENQFKSLQLRRDLEMERTVFESSSRAVVSNPLQVDGNHRCHVVDYCIIWCDTMKTYLTYFPDKMSS